MSRIAIKGYMDGIKVYVNSCNYQQLKEELSQRILRARDFFTGCKMYIVDDQHNISLDSYREIENYLREEFGVLVLYQKGEMEEKKEKVFSGIYEGKTKFYKSTIRSGQRITYNGNIVVIGDINSGAEIVANGNIVVLGKLRGMAHAGYNGNKKAYVAAFGLQPSQLRIADVITRAPDERLVKTNIPEVAKIKDDIIIIEPYLPNKYV